jgi:hypothetical protein
MIPLNVVIPLAIVFGFLTLCIAPVKFALATSCCTKKHEHDIFETNPE